MTPQTWIISDTHFQHSNMLKFLGDDGLPFRGKHFSNQKECDELMIENWNKNIKPWDKVYHLGDVFMGDKMEFEKLWARLNGKKSLIVGNHDDIRYLSGKSSLTGDWFFRKIEVWKYFKFKENSFIATHVPMQLEGSFEGEHRAYYNVHGHIHNNKSPTSRHYNACVEVNNWSPIHIEDLKDRLG